jgi:hypothetical protein
MPYINTDDKIIKCVPTIHNHYEIDNDTGYLPLRVHYYPIFLMSNNKLYHIDGIVGNYMLSEIKMANGSEYICYFNDFTRTFAKIDSKYYEICGNTLNQISIAANNARNIINTYSGIYYFIDVHNKLVSYTKTDDSYVILDDYDVDSIIFYDFRNPGCIIYKKNLSIVCSTVSNAILINTHIVDYSGSHIVKTQDCYILDSDDDLYTFVIVRHIFDGVNNEYYTTKKILGSVTDFYFYNSRLFIQNSNHEIYKVNLHDYSTAYIADGSFKIEKFSTKSANNLYRPII